MPMTKDDRNEALRRFIPWDHEGPIPGDEELEQRLIDARKKDDEELAAERAELEERRPERILERLDAIENRLSTLEQQGPR